MRGARASFQGAVLPAALISLMIFTPASAAEMTVAEAGARYGQALSAAKFCPGGKITGTATALPSQFNGADAETFQVEAGKVTAGWGQAFDNCVEIDPATHKQTTCRRMKVTSCRQAWIEIGPEGRDFPGLLDTDFSKIKEIDP